MQLSEQTFLGEHVLTSLTVFDVMCCLNKFSKLPKTRRHIPRRSKQKLQLCLHHHTKFAKFTLCRHSFQNIGWYDQLSLVIPSLLSCVLIHYTCKTFAFCRHKSLQI